jgi:predicted Ser/Thr protein kinase
MTADKKKIKLGEFLLPKDVVVRFNEQYKMSEELDGKLKELAELARKNRERAKSADEKQLRMMYKDQGKDKPHHNHRRKTELLGYVALLE